MQDIHTSFFEKIPISSNMSQCDFIFNYVTLGDSGVGKSCLTHRFTDKKFKADKHEVTIGTDFGNRIATFNGRKIKLRVWDTAGEEKYRAITRTYYRGATGALLVYDITSRESFAHVASWLNDIRDHVTDATVMLIGNKSDLEDKRAVSTEEGSQFAQEKGLIFVECSAKTAKNVEDAFIMTAIAILESIRGKESNREELQRRGITIPDSNHCSRNIYRTILVPSGGSSCCSYL